MTKKKILTTSLLILLMLLLIFSQRLFDNNFKEVALLDNNMSELETCYIDEGKYYLEIPKSWNVAEKESNKYNSYHLSFKDDMNKISGYLEVIDTDEDVKAVAQRDINNLPISHSNEKIENYKVNKWRGVRVDYKTNLSTGKTCMNSVYYLKLEANKIGRFTFIVASENYKDNFKVIFNSFISSLKSQ